MLPEAGLASLLVDTGFGGPALTSPAELGAIAGVPAHEVVRLEVVAEQVAAARPSADGFGQAVRDALAIATRDAVGVKSILAYRHGFDIDPSPPSAGQVAAAAGAWLRALDAGAGIRLVDPVLLRMVLWSGVELGLPLQLHTGYGDTDLDLHRADPALLTGFLRRTQDRCPVLLLHTYPYQRIAGYLAQMFPHVYLDVGLAVNHSGAASARVIAETLEIAPFTKVLFSSDAWGLPELHLLGSGWSAAACRASWAAGWPTATGRSLTRPAWWTCSPPATRAACTTGSGPAEPSGPGSACATLWPLEPATGVRGRVTWLSTARPSSGSRGHRSLPRPPGPCNALGQLGGRERSNRGRGSHAPAATVRACRQAAIVSPRASHHVSNASNVGAIGSGSGFCGIRRARRAS